VKGGDRVRVAVLEHPDAAQADGSLGVDLGIGFCVRSVKRLSERGACVRQTAAGQLRLRELEQQSSRRRPVSSRMQSLRRREQLGRRLVCEVM
jgi:hypothetical protein